jgi:hypothetical protein
MTIAIFLVIGANSSFEGHAYPPGKPASIPHKPLYLQLTALPR